jgi:hypothetical protein
MQKHIDTAEHAESAESLSLQRPYAGTMLSAFNRTAKWLKETYGGPLVVMSASTRRQLQALHMNQNAPATEDSTRFALMELLQNIDEHSAMLRERGRTSYELPAEALEVLLDYLWGEPTDHDVLSRAIEAAKELETKLVWRTLAMPLPYPDKDPLERSVFERINEWD